MRRALVVHTGGGLGDVLLSAPVVDAVAQAGYRVDFLARAGTSHAVANHPALDDLLVIDGKDPSSFREMRLWADRLRGRGYELAILLWSTTRWAWTLYLSGIPVRVGQESRLLYSFLFTHRVRIRSEHGDEESHWTEVLLDYPRALGMEPERVTVRYPVSGEARKQAEAQLSSFGFDRQEGPLLGFHSGKGLPLTPSRWPVAHFARLAAALQEELDARLVLTGGPDEVEIVNEIERRLPRRCLNLAGRTSLPVLAAFLERVEAFVCPDSGPMHLAAAVGTPVVGIYALDEDFPRRWAPFDVPHRVVRPPRPACREGCRKPTCPDFRCYLTVAPQAVVEAVRELLAEESPDRVRNRQPL